MRKIFALALAAALLSLPLAANAADAYNIDPVHSSIEFKVLRGGINYVFGSLAITGGTIMIDESDLASSSVEISVDMNSVDTNVDKRDDHIRTADFFNVASFPTSSFKSTGLSDNGDGTWTLTGDLTFMGISHSISFPVSMMGPQDMQKGGREAGFAGSFVLNTTDFGWKDGGGLGSEVPVEVSLHAVMPAPEAASAAAAPKQ